MSMYEASLPRPSPEQTRQGTALYNTLGIVLTSYRDWFAEGVPHEWVRALEEIQQVLTRIKREAAQAAKAGTPPVQGALFAAAGRGGG